MEDHKLTAEAAAKRFESDLSDGLSAAEAAMSAEKYGKNVLTRTKRKSIWRSIWEGLTEPMMIILLIAFGITVGVNIVKIVQGHPDLVDGAIECAGILVAIILSVTITVFMEGRSAKAFEALNKIGENVVVKVKRDGEVVNIKQDEIVCGDVVLFGVGDKIPVDCRLCETTGFRVDESPLTGESVPVKKDAAKVFGETEETPLAERINMVYGGCFVTAGNATAVVTAVGDSTEIGKIAGELNKVEAVQTPIQHKLDRLGKIIALAGACAAAAIFIVQFIRLIVGGGLNFESVSEVFITSIVLIVASVPEGLPTIVAVSLALNVIKMAKQNALVKKMAACETVGCISIICSDKTGTLTENKMTVTDLYSGGSTIKPEQLNDKYFIRNICINSTANVSKKDGFYNFVGNPTECALLVAADKSGFSESYESVRAKAQVAYSYSFSSELKRMTTVVDEGGSLIAYSKGAPEVVLEYCQMSADEKRKALDMIAEFQREAKRVIGFAHGAVKYTDFENKRGEVERNLVFDGFAVITDPIRKEVYDAVAKCRSANISVKMLTGDNIVTAAAIAKELGICSKDEEVFTAQDIEKMTDRELNQKLSSIKVVARSTPLTKLRIVKMLKSQGEVVAVTGDGINDAPAIKSADVGIAMGITGTEVSKEASEIVLLDDSFSTIVRSVEWGRGIYENFQRFIMFQLTVNLSAVLVVIVTTLAGTEAPFNALELLWINIIMDGPPALTLGLEAIHSDLMSRKPTARNANIISRNMFARILSNGLVISAVFLLQVFFNFLGASGGEQKTVAFTLFVVFQLFNAFNARELKNRSIFTSLHKNKLMLVVMLITFALQFVITQFGTMVFNTVPLSFSMWLKILGTGLIVVAFSEAYKFVSYLIAKIKADKTSSNSVVSA